MPLQQLCELCKGSSNDGQKGLQGRHSPGSRERPLPQAAGVGVPVGWVGTNHISTVDTASLQWAVSSTVTLKSSCTCPCWNVQELCWLNVRSWAHELW